MDEYEWMTIGFKEGNGTTTEPKNYSFQNNISDLKKSKIYYRLKQIDFNGDFNYSKVEVSNFRMFIHLIRIIQIHLTRAQQLNLI